MTKRSFWIKTHQRLEFFFLSILGFNQSLVWRFCISWGVFLVIGILLPVLMLKLSNCPGCVKGQIKSFEIGIVVSQACLAAASLICLSHNLRKYGVRKFLSVDRYSGMWRGLVISMYRRSQYACVYAVVICSNVK